MPTSEERTHTESLVICKHCGAAGPHGKVLGEPYKRKCLTCEEIFIIDFQQLPNVVNDIQNRPR